DAGIGLNIDAEEADRLDLSLDVIEAVLSHPDFAGWDGFGVVVQAYGKRAGAVIDWLHALAERFDRKIMVRLVKGAYWDTEIKRAQVEGLAHFPVYSDKAATDVSYICCARKLLDHSDRLYPQFATHNAHTVAAILDMAGNNHAYEFQRLHGMGAALHDILVQTEKARCRIYAPVGPHKDLLAYLVRRLLENGANSSFVNQIVDEEVPAETVARDPFDVLETTLGHSVTAPSDIFAPTRRNSAGWDLNAPEALARLHVARDRFAHTQWGGQPLIIGPPSATRPEPVRNPANPDDSVGQVTLASIADVDQALAHASPWSASPAARRQVLWDAADLYEAHAGELFALLCREAGKTGTDAVSELREAVDFLRFYGSEAERFADETARGTIACISPWNFPLAIFTGQIAAALAAGNAVLAKPADPTPLVATCATRLLHQAGVPAAALQLLPGTGQEVGAKMTSDPRVDGICFTGSTRVAQIINQAAAASLAPDAMFIAETGGLNAMIVDSTALPEQAVRDILDSAFRSCGQRCSALRVLYLQEDVAAPFLQMLYGAMEELALGDPWDMATDVGPVITEQVHAGLSAHVEAARRSDRLLKQVAAPGGLFFGPAVIAVDSILDLEHEMFGPILHVATFKADQIDQVVDDINRTGYGLTFGLHTRIDDRVEQITKRLQVGNLYVNRNQIGAVVGSQPFGGDGMSGTGPKAGGPRYLEAFFASPRRNSPAPEGPAADVSAVQAALDAIGRNPPVERDARALPGPTGESNRWSLIPRGTVLCLGPTPQDAKRQMDLARACGCAAVGVAPGLTGAQCVDGVLDRQSLTDLSGVDVVVLWSDAQDQSVARQALAARDGPMLRLVCADDVERHCLVERHLCVDTTAAGGNATLLAAQ
ncbi:MAG: bifunctional proline dehydrogenase/L-glutamate gamma-semialdehyde dehydrogenase PutA, partial [Pseudomonadota bacterium]